jgi:isoleucyl-tRNA synthetase
VAAALEGLDASRAAAALRDGGEVHVAVDGKDHALGPDDVQLVLQPLEGYQVERSGTHAVALNLELDEELRREGLAREVVHAVQNARKEAGLEVEDRIELSLGGDEALLAAVTAHSDYVTGETLATSLELNGAPGAVPTEIEGRPLLIAVRRA